MATIEEANVDRVESLVPIRHYRMASSPFSFYRGTAGLMAFDLAQTPNSGIMVQLSSDAHCGNFGAFATPERNVIFDVRDFDERYPGRGNGTSNASPRVSSLPRKRTTEIVDGQRRFVDEAPIVYHAAKDGDRFFDVAELFAGYISGEATCSSARSPRSPSRTQSAQRQIMPRCSKPLPRAV